MRRISKDTGRGRRARYCDSRPADEKGVAPTYIAMVNHNIRALTGALGR